MTDLSSTSTLGSLPGLSGTSATNASNLAAGQQNLSTAYTDFLTLLTTQLKNQDPTQPLDTNTFTQQLVSMTGVQQQLLTNELLQQVVAGSSGSVASGVGLIGKTVTATSDTATLSGGQASWTYSLPAQASSVTGSIENAAGQVVWSGSLSGLSAGQNSFTWNGQNYGGGALPDGGTYTLTLTAQDATGAAITPTLSVSGVASAVSLVNGVQEVTVNGSQIPVSALTTVSQ